MAVLSPRCGYITLIVLGTILTVVGIVLLFELPDVIHNTVDDTMPLKNGTDVYNAWVDPPVPVYMQFWVWHLQNKDDYVKRGIKPKLQQRGPYTYREIRPKKNIEFSDNGTLVTYTQPKSYVFMRNMSVGPETDKFVTVNFPLLSVATLTRFMLPDWLDKILAPFLNTLGEHLFKEYTVGGYLWGFTDPVIQDINNFTRKWFFNKTLIPNDTFGLFYGPTGNGTADGLYTINTGEKNLSQYLEIDEWQHNKTVSYWNNDYCNEINGTDGSGWHPFLEKDETLYIFSSDVCRSVYVTYAGEQTIKGIPMWRFSPPPSVMADNATNPDNAGFCTPDCLGSGVLNISSCREGAPVIISQPHFYQGAQEYIDAFEGIHPTEAEHATVLDIEPMTGAALNAEKKLQLNFYIRKFDLIEDTKLMNTTIFPVVWLNESGKITDEAAAGFKQRVTELVSMSRVLPWVLIAVGLVLLLVGVALVVYLVVVKGRQEQVPADSDDDGARDRLLNGSDPHTSYSATQTA